MDKILLKDLLFNYAKVSQLAEKIASVYPAFPKEKFIQNTVAKFPELELKQRITWISENLKENLPSDYRQATSILLKSLPAPSDNTKSDNDFGEFIYAPYAEFIARNGVTKQDLEFSLAALKEITTRFSGEDAIRYFINAFPQQTMQHLLEWSTDSHYHVRRLASEGTRPKLPWAQKIILSPEQTIPLLDNLFSDKTRFVSRSVANHLNDISKINPQLAISTLVRWEQSLKQNPKEMNYIINHALRSLIKQGHPDALSLLNYSSQTDIEFSDFFIKQNPVTIGQSLEFEFSIKATRPEQLIIDYIVYFQNKKGSSSNKKVFKLKRITLNKDQSVVLHKKHPMRANMTTRQLYPGEHRLQIQINGTIVAEKTFELQQ